MWHQLASTGEHRAYIQLASSNDQTEDLRRSQMAEHADSHKTQKGETEKVISKVQRKKNARLLITI